MRVRSQWTPGGVVLWLIAAILATFIVCSETPPEPEPPAVAEEIEFELEGVE